MSVKPIVAAKEIRSFLRGVLNQPIRQLTVLTGGQIAQALAFRAGEQEYVLRLTGGGLQDGFEKETFLYRHFATPDLPIPPVVAVGQWRGLGYAITHKMPGRGLTTLTREEYLPVLPHLLETLFALHRSRVDAWQGFGPIGPDGSAPFRSWRAFLAQIMDEEPEGGFYGRWHRLFETSFLDRALYESVYRRMLALLDFCPEERWLVHGGFGYNNVLAENGRVTAVIDWFQALYGDFVYDIAYLDFWPPFGIDFVEQCRQLYTARGVALPNYSQRVACYRLYTGLDGLRFFAKTNQREAYDATCQKIAGFLGEIKI